MRRYVLGKSELVLSQGDITKLDVDAIVNAANERMLGGGGVDGAIHRAAGPELLAACEKVAEVRPGVRCPTGEARITPGFRLPAKWVIHTVGPVYARSEDRSGLLASCHVDSLRVADELGAKTVAFPAISTGVYGYPVEEASSVAIDAVRRADTSVEEVRFVLFGRDAFEAFERALGR